VSKSYYEYGRKPHPKKVGRPQKFSDDRLLTLIAVSRIDTVPGLAYWLKAKENTVYYLRSGPSGQVWNVTGKIKKDTYYWLVEAGPIADWPSLQAEEKEAWKWQEPQEAQ